MPKVDEILGRRPLTVNDVLRKTVVDEKGFHHGDDGKFIPKVGGAKVPRSVMNHPNERHAVFMIGGSGSGKGQYVGGYIGTEGRKDRSGGSIDEGHPDYMPAQPGFHHSRVIDSDAIKATIPLYTPTEDEHGLGGPSGPHNAKELALYPPEKIKAVTQWIKKHTPFKSIAEFAQKSKCNSPQGTHYGGGLTHELSSWMARNKMNQAISSPDHGSFVYDAVGSREYPHWADKAMKNGYHVTFHHVDVPSAVGHMRSDLRGEAPGGRKVPGHIVRAAHSRVKDEVNPVVRKYAREAAAEGKPVTFVSTPNYKKDDLEVAQALGYK